FQEIESYARDSYPSFTKLLRMTFDEASALFPDGEIDLLHIDGMHTYEAVRHDFDTWWPKVKPGGVVVMHDSFDRHDNFGVWQLLSELRTEFPVSEFFHSHGLGIVLKPGGEDASHVAGQMVYADHDLLCRLRRYYEVCAGNLEYEYEAGRRSGPAQWDVTSQLFWRDAQSTFNEESSVRLAHVVTGEISEAALTLPPAVAAYDEFQINLTLSFALLEIYAILVLDQDGTELCRWSMPEDLLALQGGGLHSILAEDGTAALVLNTPLGSQVRLPVSDLAKERLRRGGTFVVRMRALDANGFTQRMAAAYGASETRHREVVEGLAEALRAAQETSAERARRVNELETSFIQRLTRRFR
ncbi:MAG: class I SAM-dependent methyltransferase, partial [Bryobacteraceae bacterium]